MVKIHKLCQTLALKCLPVKYCWKLIASPCYVVVGDITMYHAWESSPGRPAVEAKFEMGAA
jgi:hypothetical protein